MNAKRLVKAAAAATIGRLLAGDSSSRVVVLCYHSVHPTKRFASAAPDLFERHLEWLRTHCDVVDFADAPERARRTSARPAVALTFDDGYEDNYTHAFPLLRQYGLGATIFLTVGAVERDPAVLARLRAIRQASEDEMAPLTWSQITEMRGEGLEFGSHTYSHPNLARLSEEDARSELVRSRAIIEDRLGVQVTSFAYPFGKPGAHFTRDTMRIVDAAGYERAAAILSRRVRPSDDVHAIPRFFATRDSVDVIAAKIRGHWDFLGIWQDLAPRWLADIVSPADSRISGDR